jgi:hypothetical protein
LVELLIKHKVGVINRTLEVTTLDDEYWGVLAGIGKDKVEPKAEPAKTTPSAKSPQAEDAGHQVKKPVAFTLLGEAYAVSSWRDVLLGACAALAAHNAAFIDCL